MMMRVLAVITALAIMVGVPVAAVKLAPHGLPLISRHVSAAQSAAALPVDVRHFPDRYVGVVSNDVAAFDEACGCTPNVAIHYIAIGEPINMTGAKLVLDAKAVPLLELEPFNIPLRSIIAGRENAWFASYAKALLDLNAPVILSFAPEANGDWYQWGYRDTTAKVYVRAWRYVVTLFRHAGLSGHDVQWAWIMNRGFLQGERLRLLWPGDAYVNMLGIDGYFKNRKDTFRSLFVRTINDMRSLTTEPIVITETAGGPTAPKLRAVQQLVAGVVAYHLAGFCWFDRAQSGDSTHQNWQLEPAPAALAAFRQVVERNASPVG